MKFLLICVSILVLCQKISSNLTCYQCITYNDDECGPEYAKSCSSEYDRCAIHKIKSKDKALETRRACGLAPCSFQDKITEKSLGMDCDTSREEYYCLSCCKENNCNKNEATIIKHKPIWTIIISINLLIFVYVYYNS